MNKKTLFFYVLLIFIAISTIGLMLYSSTLDSQTPPPSAMVTELTYSAVRAVETATISPTVSAYWARVGEEDLIWSACVDGYVTCDENMLSIYDNAYLVYPDWRYSTAHPGRQVIFSNNSVASIYENVTITPSPTATIPPTATLDVPVINQCVKVVWDKGTVTQGLNMRPGPSMYNAADGRSYLGPGFIFRPLEVRETWEGAFAKVAEPDWWIAMSLVWSDNTYAVFWECP